ncbi:MAG: dynamin family protein [Prochloraceae cyanobacterium]
MNDSFIQDLERVSKERSHIAATLKNIAQTLTEAESAGDRASGKLGLEREIDRLSQQGENLAKGVFKLLVMGDMKRGKSTLVNALVGDRLLPTDVTPCTAILTILKYGSQARATLYFNDDRAPQQISFAEFQRDYTIDPDRAEQLEATQELAFPDVDRAEIEYPLDLLKGGIEIVDTPGLNDTEARNRLVFEYINKCHAILFVLSATQIYTQEERRYLNNYLKDRGVEIFFLVNGWDKIRSGLVDPENSAELTAAEGKIRQVMRSNLAQYTELYEERVFEVSALEALRLQKKSPEAIKETGFGKFLDSLDRFLTLDRAQLEYQQATLVAQRAYNRVYEAVERRIPLLGKDKEELKDKIASLQTQFDQLAEIRDRFKELIARISDRYAKEISDDFTEYILGLDKTFEKDFPESQVNLEFFDFIKRDKREEFYTAFERSFERYINDRLANWELNAKDKLAEAFEQLNEKSEEYKIAYDKVVDVINEKLLGYRFYAIGNEYKGDRFSPWFDRIEDLFAGMPDNINKSVRPFNGFVRSVLVTVCAAIIVNFIGLLFSLNVIGVIVAGFSITALQAEFVRRQFIDRTKEEFTKYLPTIAKEQSPAISQAIKRCFEEYEAIIIDRVDSDISARQTELNNLLEQKEAGEIDRETEIKRLKELQKNLSDRLEEIKSIAS